MNTIMNIITRSMLFMAIVCLLVMSSMAAAADGKADGTLTVAGKPVKLAYAYASTQPGFFDKKTEDTVVLLTDVPLTGKALDDSFQRSNLAKQGKLHCLEVTINSQKQPISVTIRHPSFRMPQSGGSTEDTFEAKVFDGKVVEGRVFRASPGTSFDDLEFTYDAAFSAAVSRKGK